MNTNFQTDVPGLQAIAAVLSRLSSSRKVLIACSFALLVAEVPAQEYTLRDFVNDADAVIVARIVSKEASRMEVRTRQPDGRISESTPIFTKYGVKLIQYSGPEKFSDISEFVLPGGTIGLKQISWTHTPEFQVGFEILISLEYDELNDYYIPWGVPPLGRDAGVYFVREEHGKRILIPYRSHTSPELSISESVVDKMKSNVSSQSEMLSLEDTEVIDFNSFWAAVMEAGNEK